MISCAHCGALCEPGNWLPPRQYCSARCRHAARNVRRTADRRAGKACKHCGGVVPLDAKGNLSRAWCSVACKLAGQRAARAARAQERQDARHCKRCGTPMAAAGGRTKYCSSECAYPSTARGIYKRRSVRENDMPCRGCSGAIPPQIGNGARRLFCSPECRARFRSLQYVHRRRARFVEHVDPRVVFERDNWTCQLCGEPIDRDAAPRSPRAASLDHIDPVSLGGEHSYANVQTAHCACNSSKGNRPRAAEVA